MHELISDNVSQIGELLGREKKTVKKANKRSLKGITIPRRRDSKNFGSCHVLLKSYLNSRLLDLPCSACELTAIQSD